MWTRASLACLALIVTGAATASADDPGQDAELFRRAFGTSAASVQAIPIQFEIGDGETTGTVAARVSPTMPARAVRFQAAPLLSALEPSLVAGAQAKVKARVDGQGELSVGDLLDVGLESSFDHGKLRLHVTIPPRLRAERRYELGGPGPSFAGGGAAGSRFSAFLNLRVADDLTFGAAGPEPLRAPAQLQLEGAANLRGFVLESRAEVLEGPGLRWRRGETRLVRDLPDRLVRLSAGDIAVSGSRFTAPRSLLGLSAVRTFALDPTRAYRPDESMELFLERPSRVDVLVNGQKVQTLQLPAGTHRLEGLALPAGSDEVVLDTTDDRGVTTSVRKRTALDVSQLAAGVHQFQYAVGVPATSGPSGRAYQLDRPMLHLQHRVGLSRSVTAGGILQVERDAQLAGAEVLWATWAGSFSASAAFSHHHQRPGWAAGGRWELQRTGGFARSFLVGISGDYQSGGFSSPGEVLSRTGAVWSASAYYAQSFVSGISARLEAGLRTQSPPIGGPAPGWWINGSVSRSFSNGLGMRMEAIRRPGFGSAHEVEGRLSLVWAWPDARRSVVVSSSVSGRDGAEVEATVNQQVTALRGTVDTAATVASAAGQVRTAESARFTHGRVEAEVTHGLAIASGTNRVHARVGTAIVFADGVFAWSRPVNDSFAVVVPTQSLEGAFIGVDPTATGAYAATADRLGPAVLSDVQPYTWSTVRLDAPSLTVGQSIDAEVRTVRTSYRGGAVLRVGAPGRVYLIGRAVDAKGAPAALQTGKLIPLFESMRPPELVFTNADGRFVLMGVEPGRYRLQLEVGAATIAIPEGRTGIFETGSVTLH
ncbi:MAG: hypothetical protein IRZ16_14825 [Myxococcaceae bacterium]|nr:hypothetical protein [Myxococcaceae bacterium]